MHPDFEFTPLNGRARLHTYSTIAAAPTGFDDQAPYTIGVADLETGGRILAWMGESIPLEEIRIGMDLQVVPRVFEELEEIKVYYSIERPETTWAKSGTV